MVLLAKSTDRVHVSDPGHGAELGLDDPVLDLAQIGRRVGSAIRFACIRPRLDDPHVDLSQAGRGRPQHRRADARRQILTGGLQSFAHELAREVDVRAVTEHHGYLGEPEAGQGPDLLHIGEPGHRRFDGNSDLFLDLDWGQRLDDRIDLDLHRGDVRYSVDRQPPEVVDAEHCHGGRRNHHKPSLMHGKVQHAGHKAFVGLPEGRHQSVSSTAPLPSSDLRMKAFLTTTESPAASPRVTSVVRPSLRPSKTV